MTGSSGTRQTSPIHRLRGTRAYVCGAMDRVQDGGVVWRQHLTPCLNRMGIVVMNPCEKPYVGAVESHQDRTKRKSLKKAGRLEECGKHMKDVCDMDLHMVNVSDFLVASIDLDVHLCGSYEEIFRANMLMKPVLCWVRQGRAHTPDWLLGRLPHQFFFDTVDALLDYLRHVDESPVIETFGRWFTPCFSMLYDPEVLAPLHSGV